MAISVAELCQQNEISVDQLAEQSLLDKDRLIAIIEGRWTPSPSERSQVAAALGVEVADVAWGHKTPIQHLWG